MKGLLGKKIGMTQVYNERGDVVSVTAIQAGPCTVMALRTMERDGYSALQLGFSTKKIKNVSKAIQGHIKAAGYSDKAPAWIREVRLDAPVQQKPGDTISVDIFAPGEIVDVTGTTKGRGFQGVVKRYRFAGGKASHGGAWLRRPGSVGMKASPAKIYKGRRLPGHMGNARKTIQNLKIVEIRKDDHVIMVKGAVPGPIGGFVLIRSARKGA